MAVCGINNQDVHSGFDKPFNPLIHLWTYTDSGPDPEAAKRVFAGVRILLDLLDVFYCDKSFQLAVIIYDKQFSIRL